MCSGPALKKSWKEYKMAGRNGMYRGDIAWGINRIQSAMGIEKSEYPELEGISDEESEEELNDEEIQLRREEKEDAGDWGFEKPEESYAVVGTG